MSTNQQLPKIVVRGKKSKNLMMALFGFLVTLMMLVVAYLTWGEYQAGVQNGRQDPSYVFIISLIGVPFFAFSTFISFKEAFADGPVLELSSEGISYRIPVFGEGHLTWDAIDYFEKSKRRSTIGVPCFKEIVAYFDKDVVKTKAFRESHPRLFRISLNGKPKKMQLVPGTVDGKLSDILEQLETYHAEALNASENK